MPLIAGQLRHAGGVLPTVVLEQLLQLQDFGQLLLDQCLLRRDRHRAPRPLLAFLPAQQLDLLDPPSSCFKSSTDSPGQATSAWLRTCCGSDSPSMQ